MPEFRERSAESKLWATVVVTGTDCASAKWRRTLRSLTAQSLGADDFETVCVVGSSSTPELRGLGAEPRRIRWLAAPERAGSALLNVGIDAARGAYLLFMDAGDALSPSCVQSLLRSVAPGRVALARVSAVDLDEKGVPKSEAPSPLEEKTEGSGHELPLERMSGAFETAWAKLLPASVARQVRFDPSLEGGAAADFWLRALDLLPMSGYVADVGSHALYYRYQPPSLPDGRDRRWAAIARSLDVLAGVSAAERRPGPAQEAAARLSRRQGRRINTVLRQRPQMHPDVVEEMRARRLTSVPYEIVNEGLARDLAILYCFLPHVDTSALVAARRIRARGRVVDVVSQDLAQLRPVDPSSKAISEEFVDGVTYTGAHPTFAGWPRIRAFCNQAAKAIEEMEKRKGPYRSVYSRSMWPASHIMAALYKIRNPGTPWLAEFSDPMLHNIKGEHRTEVIEEDPLQAELAAGLRNAGVRPPDSSLLYDWVEVLAYALADDLLFTNPLQRDYMLGYCADTDLAKAARAKSSVERHPTLPPEYYRHSPCDYKTDPRLAHIAYFGVLYATRGLTEIVDAVRSLDAQTRSALRIHVFTSKPDDVEADMAAHGLSDALVARPYVPYLEFLNLTTRFDALMVNDADTRDHHPVNPYLPSKWSDYSGSGAPIWAIVEPGSMLSGFETAYRSLLGDVDGARRVLEQVVADKRAADMSVNLSRQR